MDESGRFQYPDLSSRFYVVTMVFHDQNDAIDGLLDRLDADWVRMRLHDFCFHAGPVIRKEKGYVFMSRHQRTAIFSRMLLFARQMPFRFHCLCVDKKYVTSSRQIVARLQTALAQFIASHDDLLGGENVYVKVYYDCGQSPVTNLLHDTFISQLGTRVTFAQSVRPEKYKLFQLADLICTVKLLILKLKAEIPFTESEKRFFGGPRRFLRNVAKQFVRKEIN